MSMVFSTDSLENKDKFSYWHEVVTKYYAPCTGLTNNKENFSATTTVQDVGLAELSHVISDGIRYDRRPSDLRSTPREDIFLSIMLEGEGYFSQNDHQVKHQAGDILIYDSAKPYCFNYSNAYKSMLLKLPRSLVQTKISHIDQLGGTIIKCQSVYGKLIKSLMQDTLVIASSPELSQKNEFILPTLEMLTTAMQRASDGREQATDTGHSKLLSEIKTYIHRHITDEELSINRIATENNVSVRTLSRLFAEIGETPRNWLQMQRLSFAYEALATRKVSNVTQAALTFGYKDLSQFSRTFKKQYGISPKDLYRTN
ncbi:MAG: helix-turn-helix domain-containing protein [Gammaproteobacteria bacterium]|nr:helix-turn-helix domain-containing protein [Gammaproteobacteria bacterium]